MKKTLLTGGIAASMLLAGAGAAQAELVTIDFDSFDAGVSITDQIAGVHVGLINAPEGEGPRTMALPNYDYSPASGIALRPSYTVNTTPNTLGAGPWRDLSFTFDEPTDYFSILALDADEPVNARAYLGGDLVDSISFRAGSNFQVYKLELGGIGGEVVFDHVVVDLVTTGQGTEPGPEIFDNLQFTRSSVPTPGALTLLCTSGLLAMRRRRCEG
ncbi:MAG: hypothetical protein H6813_06110 [Phycisphaeraceae bacterium]|nr:hypothetical protein [Phycisphaeraceae bacterium]MCB9848044.1 hypothetical protein [Phycisphaeraceae bacterium]